MLLFFLITTASHIVLVVILILIRVIIIILHELFQSLGVLFQVLVFTHPLILNHNLVFLHISVGFKLLLSLHSRTHR